MATKKTIAIIGATEKSGLMLSKKLAGSLYRLLLFSNEKDKLDTLQDEIKRLVPTADIDSSDCPVEASWEADIVIAASTLLEEKELVEKIRQVTTQKIVICILNQFNHRGQPAAKNIYPIISEDLQKRLPDSKLVPIYFTVNNRGSTQTKSEDNHNHVFITGNDKESLQTVSELIAYTGFKPVVAGRFPTTSREKEKFYDIS